MSQSCQRFNTIQYDIDLKHVFPSTCFPYCFNTIQYDIDLKLAQTNISDVSSFNTIQYDIDLKPQIARSSPIHREYRYIEWLI